MGYIPSSLYNDTNWPDIQVYVASEVLEDNNEDSFTQHIFMDHALLRPKSYGTVRLSSTNPEDPVLIDPRFFEVQEDLERLVDGTKAIQRHEIN